MSPDIRVLIVDDSPFCAEAIAIALEEEPGFHVVGFAHDGLEAVELARRLRPDVVTMDVQMPVMNGLEAISRIMDQSPARILVLTGDPRGRGGELSFEALARGALDLQPKTELTADAAERRRLREKLRLLATATLPARRNGREASRATVAARGASEATAVIGIVSSTGGPSALESVLSSLPAQLPAAIAIVQHLPRGFAERMVHWLAKGSAVEVRLAEQGAPLRPGVAYLAADDHHLLVDRDRIRLDRYSPAVGGHRPAGNVLLESISRTWGSRSVGVVLTGMGDDGAKGLLQMRQAGAVTIAQDAASCVVDGMPAAARDLGAAAEVHALRAIPERLAAIVRKWADLRM